MAILDFNCSLRMNIWPIFQNIAIFGPFLDLLWLFFGSDGLNFGWRDLKMGAYESPPPYNRFDVQHAHTLWKLSQIVPKTTVFDLFLHVFGFGGLIFTLRDLKMVACESPHPEARFDVRHAHTLTKSHFGPPGPPGPPGPLGPPLKIWSNQICHISCGVSIVNIPP